MAARLDWNSGKDGKKECLLEATLVISDAESDFKEKREYGASGMDINGNGEDGRFHEAFEIGC